MKVHDTKADSFLIHPVIGLAYYWCIGCLVFFLCAGASAVPVSEGEAVLAVQGWLRMSPEPLGEILGVQIDSVAVEKDEVGTPLYYIVSLASEGYVICSSDTEVEPILVFSSTGPYEADPENPLHLLIEKDVQGRLKMLRKSSKTVARISSQSKPAGKWKTLQMSAESGMVPKGSGLTSINDPRVDPFIQSRWNQSTVSGNACYNYYTPPYASGSSDNYVCGCNNTAWAQVMRYFQYPTQPVGTASHSIRVDGVSQTRSLRGGDGAGGAYEWSQMPLIPSSPSTAERQAIGALCADIGVANGTSYAAAGSSAGMSESTLKNVFFYSNSRYISGDDCVAEAIRPNLDARLPVVLSIRREGSGHAVLCDGYGFNLSASYYHLNLGWGGQKDAWYNLPDVDTDWYQYDTLASFQCNIYTNGTGEIISGRVLDGGTPVAGAVVTAAGGGQTHHGTTDSRGIYALSRLPSNEEYVLTVQKSGFQFDSQTATTGYSPSWSTSTGNSWSNDISSSVLTVLPSSCDHASAASSGHEIEVSAHVLWTASEDLSWVTITDGSSGSGNGIVTYSVAENTGGSRSGTIRVSGDGITRLFTVNQVNPWPALSSAGDFDGDFETDLATFQPSTGNWNVLFSAGGQSARAFGSSSMVAVPADYDGDGRLDEGLYRPSNGTWYILYSGGGSKMKQFGWSKTIPLPGDYDGDGWTDMALFYPNRGRWYFLCSQAGGYSAQFGGKSDIPVPADYDGDGATDVAVYRPSSGMWYVICSGGGYKVQQLGWSGTIPVPGDYDGDGQVDIAVLSRNSSKWCITYSGGGSLILAFGYKTMTPVQADYDGDGATDIAMYHEASGTWYIRESTTGMHRRISFGGPGQIPVLLYPMIYSWFGLP